MRIEVLLSTRKHMPLWAEDLAIQYGFNGIELVMLWDEPAPRQRQFPRLQHVKAIHAPIADFDTARFTEALQRGLDLATQLNVPLVNMHPGSMECGGRQNVEDCYQIAKDLAQQSGREVAIEILPKPEKEKHRRQRAYEDPTQWVEDLKKFELPGTIDTTHLASWEEESAKYVSLVGKHFAHLHVSDFRPSTEEGEPGEQHRFIGDGTIRFGRLFKEIRRNPPGREVLYVTLEQAGRYDLARHEGALRDSLQKLQGFAKVSLPSGV